MTTTPAIMRRLLGRIDWTAVWQYALLIVTGADAVMLSASVGG